MATVDNLTLEITADSRKAVQAIDQLSMAMKTLKTNMPTSAKLENTAKGFKALTTEISKLSLSAKNLDKIKAIGTIAKNLNKINTVNPNVMKNTAKGLDALSTAVSGISYESILKLERMSKALSGLPQKVSVHNIQKAANATQTTPATSGTTQAGVSSGFANVQTQANNATQSVSGFWTKYQTVSQMVKSNPISLLANAEDTQKMATLSQTLGLSVGAVSKLSTALGAAGIAFSVVSSAVGVFTNAIKKVLAPIKNFIKSLGRIAMYRALRSILKGISQGLREGIQNLALYSKALDGLDTHNANEVLSRYASAFLYVKNAIATAVMPVLRALIPLIEQAMFRLVDFINIIAQVGSVFFGTNFTKAKYFWVDYADSLDKTTGRAKALHHQLAQFDELNNLSAPSGGSGSDKLADASQMFEEAQIDEKIKGIVDKITGAFNTVKEMFEPVKRIVDKAKELFELSWEKISPNLKRIWNSLKNIWNNTLKPFIDGFIKGFVDGFLSSDTFKNLPDFLGLISDKVADVVEKFEKLTKVLTPDQWERLGKAIGFVVGWVIELITNIVTGQSTFSNFLDRVKKLRDYLAETFAPEIQGTKAVIGYLIDKVKDGIQKFWDFVNPVNSVKSAIDYAKTSFENFKGVVERLIDKLITNKDTLQQLRDKGDAIRNFFTNNNIFGKTADHADTLWSKLFNARTELKNTEDRAVNLKNWFNNNPVFAQAQHSAELFKAVLDGIRSVLDGLKNFTCNIGFNYSTSGSVPSTQPSSSGSSTTTTTTTTTTNNNNKNTNTNTNTGNKGGTQSTGQKPNTTQNTTSGRPTTTSSSSNGNYGGFGSLQEYIQAQKQKALGGFVPNGDLFIANEKGAEMIGSIGGNTAVANNNQITEAIAQATYTAMTKALAENGGNMTIVVEGDGDKMFRVFQKKQTEYQRKTGLAY